MLNIRYECYCEDCSSHANFILLNIFFFQELMLDSANTKNLIEATNKQHLFEKLEDLQKRCLYMFRNQWCQKSILKGQYTT